jgi:hypothetical protein
MTRLLFSILLVSLLAGCASMPVANSTPVSAPARLSYDFNAANPWPTFSTIASDSNIFAQSSLQPVGTIDMAGTSNASGGLLLAVDSSKANKVWNAALDSGPLAVATGETDLGKLTLGFMLSASSAQPVSVRIESIDKKGRRSGGLAGAVYPAAPDFYQRYSLDVSTLKRFGKGKFNPADPFIRLTFGIGRTADGRGWPASADNQLRLDNVSYSGPAFYVSPDGNDSNNGRTEKTAFATPQAALDVAQPGDIILLKAGTYNGGLKPTASFTRAGTPAAWIVLKNYPGQKPLLTGNAWNIVGLSFGSKGNLDREHELAYLEIRGLHVRGESDLVPKKFPETIGKSDPRSNGNGISVDGRYMTHVPHHIRIADNLVEYCPGGGIGSIEGDRITFENNISRDNCWHTIYATSGFSVMGTANFDTADNVYKDLLRYNISHRNETKQKWAAIKKFSDGNGIILDVNQSTDTHTSGSYIGRTLVINNLSYDNGGSGIHTVRANRVDIINNTAYLNSASPALQYSEIFTYGSTDVRIINNILVAPIANLASGAKPYPVNRLGGKNTNVVFLHNLYFGGNIPPTLGEGDQIGDPKFVNPSRDESVADFRLKLGSPAIDAGTTDAPALPLLDLDGRFRPQGETYDLGAYEFPAKRH